MIKFFRDVLDGPIYIGITILSIIFIMAIIGFLMERKKLEKEAKNKIAVVADSVPITPIPPVSVTLSETSDIDSSVLNVATKDSSMETVSSNEVQNSSIIFEQSNQKINQ